MNFVMAATMEDVNNLQPRVCVGGGWEDRATALRWEWARSVTERFGFSRRLYLRRSVPPWKSWVGLATTNNGDLLKDSFRPPSTLPKGLFVEPTPIQHNLDSSNVTERVLSQETDEKKRLVQRLSPSRWTFFVLPHFFFHIKTSLECYYWYFRFLCTWNSCLTKAFTWPSTFACFLYYICIFPSWILTSVPVASTQPFHSHSWIIRVFKGSRSIELSHLPC